MSYFKQEDLDIESFLNLDGAYSSPSASSASLKGKAIAAPEFQPPVINQNTFAPLQHSSQPFSGPSHQYDLHKQQIPLPPGALANTLAATQRNTFSYNGFSQELGMGSSSGMYEMSEDFFDFNAMPSHNPSFSGSNDMDMDFDSPIEGNFSNDGEFVDPNAIGGHEDDSPNPTRAEIVRVYPGMHRHQAEQAALAKQQQQLEIQRQQQQRAVQRSQNPGHKSTPSRSSGNRTPMDPAVEERISRLLSQMRQSNGSPSDSGSQKESHQGNMSRSKKEEEDMDEDERLLASEEGKKLSSKERRQLRNKVSARAFRSRRKEYIGQLEGEVAAKASETDSLRAENEALKAENSRLTDLTKLLLSSSAFSTFLNDLSTNGLPASIVSGPTPTTLPPQQPQPRHDANSSQQQYQMQQHGNAQIGMAMIPEQNVDFSSMESTGNWNTGLDFNFAPQVFAVTELPEGPAVDSISTDALSGKSNSMFEYSSAKEEKPIIEALPKLKKPEPEFICDETVEFDNSDPAFALFNDVASHPVASMPVHQVFGSIQFEKAVARYDLIVDDEDDSEDGIVSASTMARFESLCSDLDSISRRLDGMMGRI